MPIKRIATVAALAAALALGFAGDTFAHGPGGRRGHGWGGMGPGMMGHFFGGFGRRHHAFGARPLISYALDFRGELKLTDEQVKKLRDLRDAFFRKWIRERAELQTLRLDLRRALDAEKMDLADVEKRIRAIEKKRADLRIDRLRTIDRGKAALTDEQRKRLRQLVEAPFPWARRFGMGMMGPGRGTAPGTGGPRY